MKYDELEHREFLKYGICSNNAMITVGINNKQCRLLAFTAQIKKLQHRENN